jgi:GAF domain-containing protein
MENLYNLTVDLCSIRDQDALISKLANLLLEQFDAYHVWAGLRETTNGPITCHGGCTRAGHQITLEQLLGKKIIKEALQSESYILLPNLADATSPADTNIDTLVYLRSAMAVPIASPTGAYGIIYVDNGTDKNSYTHHDLDYLTLVGTLIAAFIEHIG